METKSVAFLVDELKMKIIEEINLVKINPESITAETSLFREGLGLDSIDALELVVIFERDYGIDVEDIEAMSPHFATMGTLSQFVSDNRTK
ncbi:phosphopantetheine-binding protein [Flavobacterium chilense]|uniref:Acyl carrier protein n=1 Tax=Flavobacterium chilense TaxID=946677 RepID=A0A1M7MWA2_9FLAO|nr:phosphopantetheine-binding protein [Flavobacterium chilense]SHM95319.1 acyl carrier protein [Flavobacterium chilense]